MWLKRLLNHLLSFSAPQPSLTTAMPWNIRRDFHIDINASYGSFLLVSATDSSLRQPPPDMISGDGMPVRFHFYERGEAGSLVLADPGPATSFIFSGRPAGVPSGSDLLFLTNDFTEISVGVWQGTLDLNTAAFQAHLDASPQGSKIILGEIEVRDSVSNTKRTSFQFDLTARPQVYQEADAAPSSLPSPLDWLAANDEPARLLTQARQQLSFDTPAPNVVNFVTKQVAALTFSLITSSTTFWRFRKPDGLLHTQNTALPAETSTSGHRPLSLIAVDSGGSVPAGSLVALTCAAKQLTALDVSGLTALTNLNCAANQLPRLDVSGLTAVTILNCSSNQLTALDTTDLPDLTTLSCSQNQITALDLRQNPDLTSVSVFKNALGSLQVSGLTALGTITAYSNNLTALDLTGLTALSILTCNDNHLTELDVSPCTALSSLTCNDNQMASLDLTGLTGVEWLAGHNNELTALDLTALAPLTYVDLNDNQLTELDLTGLTALTNIKLKNNLLPAAQVDAILIAVAASSLAGAGDLDISGTGNAAPTAASAAAVSALSGAGWFLTTN